MSSVIYNDITLPYVKTDRFSQEPKYADDGLTYIYTVFKFEISTIINADLWEGTGNGNHPATIMSNIRHRLEQPRRPLDFWLEDTSGSPTIPLLRITEGIDICGGPKPMPCEITQIVGRNTFLLKWGCETCALECTQNQDNKIISNTWTTDWEVNQDFYSTRTTRGVLKIKMHHRSDLDTYRNLAIPPLPKDWVREKASFSYAQDHLSFQYTIVDKQVHRLPPGNVATTMRGHYSESTDDGMMTFAEMELDCSGPQDVTKVEMLAKMAQVVLTRFNFAAVQPDILQSSAVVESLFENRISLRIRVLKTSVRQVANWLLIDETNIGKALRQVGDPDPAFNDKGPWGTAQLKAIINAVVVLACTDEGDSQEIWQMGDAGDAPEWTGTIQDTEVDVSTYTMNPTKAAPHAAAHIQDPYTRYEGEQEYETKSYTLVLPVASNPTESTPTDHDVVVMAPDVTSRKVRFLASRAGAHPEIPKLSAVIPQGETEAIEVMMQKYVRAEDPHLKPNIDKLEFTNRGEAVFVAKNPRRYNEEFNNLRGFKPPWLEGTVDGSIIQTDQIGVFTTDPKEGIT